MNSVYKKVNVIFLTISLIFISFFTTSTIFSVNAVPAKKSNPELRENCKWYNEKARLQDCKVYSKSMDRDINVQIRAGGQKALYFLDGARAEDKLSGWLMFTKVYETFKNDPVTLVFPAGGMASWYADWNKRSGKQTSIYKWETFISKELPEYLTANFGVKDYHNSILGLSMSGGSAITFAAKYPKKFNTVISMSAYYQTGSFQTGLIDSFLNNSQSMDMWPVMSPKWFQESPSNPAILRSLKRNNTRIVISLGDSIPYNKYMLNGSFASLSSYESLTSLSTGSYLASLGLVGIPVTFQLAKGNHLWFNWEEIVIKNRELLIRPNN